MEEIIKYKSFDGKEFEEEKDCLLYEEKMITKIGLKMYDLDFNTCCNVCEAYYIIIDNRVELELLNQLADSEGFDVPYEIGRWYYDDNDGYWIKISERLEELNLEKEKLEKIMKM